MPWLTFDLREGVLGIIWSADLQGTNGNNESVNEHGQRKHNENTTYPMVFGGEALLSSIGLWIGQAQTTKIYQQM